MRIMSQNMEDRKSFLDIPETEISSGRIVICPHCNGYGSSFKDPEGVPKCSFCGGGGVVPNYIAEKYEQIYESKKNWRKGIIQYYVFRSSIFDNPNVIYNYGVFSEVISKSGGLDITIRPAYGWNNQPDVICFWANEETVQKIKEALNKLDVFKKWGCIIKEVDWK